MTFEEWAASVKDEARLLTVHVVWSNKDLTEGRGIEYPYCVCESPSTARRLSKRASVMGSDGRVTVEHAIRVGAMVYAPAFITTPDTQDRNADYALEKAAEQEARRQAAIDKARQLGLSDDDLAALKGCKT